MRIPNENELQDRIRKDPRMTWRSTVILVLANILRFAVRAALLIDGIALAGSSIYVTVKFCWFSLRYLDRTIFSSPW